MGSLGGDEKKLNPHIPQQEVNKVKNEKFKKHRYKHIIYNTEVNNKRIR